MNALSSPEVVPVRSQSTVFVAGRKAKSKKQNVQSGLSGFVVTTACRRAACLRESE